MMMMMMERRQFFNNRDLHVCMVAVIATTEDTPTHTLMYVHWYDRMEIFI